MKDQVIVLRAGLELSSGEARCYDGARAMEWHGRWASSGCSSRPGDAKATIEDANKQFIAAWPG